MKNQVKVSVCVSVFNNAPYLPYFLDSALQQNFDDYEIVVVDNHSTDDSLNILKKYAQAFPDKIFVYQTNEHGGAGKGRNLAFKKSHGDYIYWCDSDDLIRPGAIAKLYTTAVEKDADVVYGFGLNTFEENGEILRLEPTARKKSQYESNKDALKSITFFWLRLIRRDLIERVGLMPENVIMEDVRYLMKIHSAAQKIYYIDDLIYYWYRRGCSTIWTVRKELCLDYIQADEDILLNCSPEYFEEVEYYAIRQNVRHLEIYWQYFDLFAHWLKNRAENFYCNSLIIKENGLFNKLRWVEELPNHLMPNLIYVNGFLGEVNAERIDELHEKVFHDDCEVIILLKENCDLDENAYVKRAYENGDFEFVAKYFALKNIYECGGVFIHDDIKILAPFGYLKYQNAFFALVDKNTYSDWIFGAPAGNEAIEAILKTYSDSWDKQQKYMPLSERISIILTAKYSIPLDGKARLWGDVVSVLSPDLSVCDTRFGSNTKKCAFEHDFSERAHGEDYITLPRSSLQAIISSSTKPFNGKTKREIALQKELDDIKSSNTWKVMLRVRALGDSPIGPFLKKPFHILLKIRFMFKHK